MAADQFVFEDSTGTIARLTGTLHDPGATVGDVLTVQSDKSIKAAPGGGSQPVVKALPFAWNTPNIAAASGAALWIPPIGTYIVDGYPAFSLSIPVTVFDGSGTPSLDLGTISGGVFQSLTSADLDPVNAGNLDAQVGTSSFYSPSGHFTVSGVSPYAFVQTGTDPLAVQLTDGSGGNPGSTQGEGVLYVLAFTSA